jgi:hypothetical protein
MPWSLNMPEVAFIGLVLAAGFVAGYAVRALDRGAGGAEHASGAGPRSPSKCMSV